MALTDTDRALIKAAVQPYRHDGGESLALEEITGLSTTRAYQRLSQLLDDPVAWAAEPAALSVLERRRDRNVRHRGARRRPRAATG